MAQHDYVIDNSTGANVRADINNVLQAIATNNSGSSAPSATFASQFFADTNAGIMKLRNTANSGYVNLFTLAGGIDVDAASNFNEDVTFTGASANIVFDKSDNALEFADSASAKFGADGDLEIKHNNDNSFINDTGTGQLLIQASGLRLRNYPEGHTQVNCSDDVVEIYYDNSKKLESTSSGVDISGDLVIDGAAGGTLTLGGSAAHTSKLVIADNTGSSNGNLLVEGGDGGDFFTINSAGNVKFEDNKKALFGAGADLELYHTGSASVIADSGTGGLQIRTNNLSLANAANSESMLAANENGAVELYYDNSKKFESDSAGTTTTGRAYITGTILQGTTDSGEANGDEATFANTGGNAGITIRSAVDAECKIYFSEGTSGGAQYRGAINYNHNTNYMAFSANETEKFRIDSSGNKILDNTFDTTANNARKSYFSNTGQQYHGRNAHEAYIVFQDVSNNEIGKIVRGAGSSVAYNTSSDYRLKENVVNLTNAITRLKTLKPKRFNFKSEPSITMDGFLAHEVTAVPEAIEGEKDGVITQAMLDAGTLEGTVGDPIYQGIDQSKLVPLLVAAIQELITRVETLEAA